MTYEEIANLGNLVNITVTKTESQDLIPKMEGILGYINQIQSIEVPSIKSDTGFFSEKLRDDLPGNSNFKDDFLGQVPEKENGYVKVTKVLGGDQ